MKSENKKTKKNHKDGIFVMIDSGYGGGSSPTIIEAKQNSRENNKVTMISRVTGGGGLLSE